MIPKNLKVPLPDQILPPSIGFPKKLPISAKMGTILKTLGYGSGVFKAKFGGTCGLSGLKIYPLDDCLYYNTPLNSHAVCHKLAVDLKIWFGISFTPEMKDQLSKELEKQRVLQVNK